MANEPLTAELSPRAGIAMLTLQLRSTLQEADRLERTDHTIDEAAARRQLRERVDPMLEERRRSFDEALAVARAAAQQQIAAARETAQRRAAAAAPAPVVEEPIVIAPAPVVEEPIVIAPAPVVEEPIVIAPAPLPVVARPAAAASLPAQEIKVSIDADAFARVFATVFASLVDQRSNGGMPMGQAYAPGAYVQAPQGQPMAYAPMPQPVAPRQSFWSHARHPDVLLMSLATAIVMVVVVAWLV